MNNNATDISFEESASMNQYDQTNVNKIAESQAVAPSTTKSWLMWGMATTFFLIAYFPRASTGFIVPELMHDLHASAFSLGSLSACFFWTYALMQLPVGMLVDRFGSRRLLTIMAMVCAIGCLLFSRSTNLFVADASRLLMGFGSAFAFVGILKLVAAWFPPNQFGFLAGLTQAIGMVGGYIATTRFSIMVLHTVGWRTTLFSIGATFLMIALVIWFFVRDSPSGKRILSEETTTSLKEMFSGLVRVMSNKQSWYNAFYAACIYAPTAAFAEFIGPSYLTAVHNLDSGDAVGMIFFGWMFGGPLMGWLSDHFRRRRSLMFISAAVGLLSFTLMLYLPNPYPWEIYLLLFIFGISNAGVAIAYAVANEINPKNIASTSVSFANMWSVVVGSVVFQPLIGWLLDLNWDGKMVEGIPYYSASDYKIALIILPITLAIGWFMALFVKETYGRSFEEREAEV